jgi:glycerol dehydrogenase
MAPASIPPAKGIAPSQYLAGPGVLDQLGDIVRQFGERPLLIGGREGLSGVATGARTSLSDASLEWNEIQHRGYCTERSVRGLAARVSENGADVVIGVGGGKVLDVAKYVASDTGLPCVTVPTSPATCAAVTAVSIIYGDDGRWLRSAVLQRCPDVALVDSVVLQAAPPRLLASGMVDALAKYYEVGLAARRSATGDAATLAALALGNEINDLLIVNEAAAVHQSRSREPGQALRLVSEAVILLPGLVAGLAGQANKLAAAHTIHNALTRVPGSSRSLHGELVGFGILVQMVLEQRPGAEVRDLACRFAGLGQQLGLERLGCGKMTAEQEAEVLTFAVASPVLQGAFPGITALEVREAMSEADAIATNLHSGR